MTVTSAVDGRETTDQEVSLELIGLRRRFGPVVALDGLTFSVPPGQVFGFLGPNGPGGISGTCRRNGARTRLPVQIPPIIAYALSYTVIYANGARPRSGGLECPGGQAAVGRAVLARRVRMVYAPEPVRDHRAS